MFTGQFCLAQAVVTYLMKENGLNFNAAVRALAFKWIRIIWRLWKNRQRYQEDIYLDSLRRRKSRYLPASIPCESLFPKCLTHYLRCLDSSPLSPHRQR